MPCCLFVFLAALSFARNVWAQQPEDLLLGKWEGDSICTVPNSPCANEHVVYEISRIPPAAARPPSSPPAREWKIDAYKIVNGEKQFMGALPCSFNKDKRTLNCFTNTRTVGYWDFVLQGNALAGTLHIGPEKTLYRKVSVRKSPLAKTSGGDAYGPVSGIQFQ